MFSFEVEVSLTMNCPLERAYRVPMHGDATKILTGYMGVPPIIDFIEDETWGKEKGSRIPICKKGLFHKGGRVGFDEILIKEDLKYWKWCMGKFELFSLWFDRFEGEYFVKETNQNTIEVIWKYTLFSDKWFAKPLQYLFAKIIWKGVMKQGIKAMKEISESDNQFIYQ